MNTLHDKSHKKPSIGRGKRLAVAVLGAGALSTGMLAVGAGTASAGVNVKVHSAPSASARVIGHMNADCRTIGHAPRVKGSGGYWYKVGAKPDRWIFNAARTPFCH